jgi:hypothetical protein
MFWKSHPFFLSKTKKNVMFCPFDHSFDRTELCCQTCATAKEQNRASVVDPAPAAYIVSLPNIDRSRLCRECPALVLRA